MKHEVHRRLFVGDMQACREADPKHAIVHACKTPCHQAIAGYTGSLPTTHPAYLYVEQSNGDYQNGLYLNMVDPPVPLFKPESFAVFRDFARRQHGAGRTLVIHCNQGHSRSPMLAMLFMAKDLGALPDASYAAARNAFERVYPCFDPGKGIHMYVEQNWSAL